MSNIISFIQLSDLHFAKKPNCINRIDDIFGKSNFDPTQGPTSYDRDIPAILDNEVFEHLPDFILVSGDIVTSATKENLEVAKNIFQGNNKNKPPFDKAPELDIYPKCLFIPGNHDRMIFPEDSIDNIAFSGGYTSNKDKYKSGIEDFSLYFNDKWAFKSRCRVNYDYNGLVFLFYDFSLPADFLSENYAKCNKKNKFINFKHFKYFGNGLVTENDINVLEEEIKKIQNNFPDRLIMFISHFPLVSPKVRDKKTLNLINKKCLIKLLKKYNVNFFLAGHTHDYDHVMIDDIKQIVCGTSSGCRKDDLYNYLYYKVEIVNNKVKAMHYISYLYDKSVGKFNPSEPVEFYYNNSI